MKKTLLLILLAGLALNACSSTTQTVTPTMVLPGQTPFSSPTAEPIPTSTPVAIPPAPQWTGNASPSLPSGIYENRVYQSGNAYIFEVSTDSTTFQYQYRPSTGSLNDLRIKIGDGRAFLPSNFGGPYFSVAGVEIPPWEYTPKIRMSHDEPIITDNSMEITWHARAGEQTISYTYRFSLVGKTLYLQVDSDSTDISEFTLDRSEETPGARLLFIPYLSVFNVLQYQGHFITAYIDWTKTNASGVEGFSTAFSDQSFYFGSTARYQANTKGVRNPVHETIYFTVSDVFSEVLPNIPNPVSPYREVLANRVVLDMWEEGSFDIERKLLEMLKEKGINDLLVIEHTWQNCGYDNCYPSVIPANESWGGDPALIELGKAAKEAGYLFALHENYVDIYPNASVWSPDVVALNPDGTRVNAWYNEASHMQSYLISPAHVFDFAMQFSPEIHHRYGTTASFYDVHTAANPSYKVDFNANVENSARMVFTFSEYAKLMSYARQVHEGPILGEGGDHFLYAGIVDGVEAQYLADESGSSSTTPPVVDFELLKIHPLMVNHGVGYYERYFSKFNVQQWGGFTKENLYQYMATEIAFCHAGFVPTVSRLGGVTSWVEQVEREVNLVLPIQKQCALAAPVQIQYHVNGEMTGVEQALIEDQAWQVFVEYDSGLQVYVNRHPSENWEVIPASTPAWVDYSALVDGRRTDYVGNEGAASYILPPGGWLAFLP